MGDVWKANDEAAFTRAASLSQAQSLSKRKLRVACAKYRPVASHSFHAYMSVLQRPEKEERAKESAKAMADYEAEGRAGRAKTERLRTLRLAKEAAEKNGPAKKIASK